MKPGIVCTIVSMLTSVVLAGPMVSADADVSAFESALSTVSAGVRPANGGVAPTVWSVNHDAVSVGARVLGGTVSERGWHVSELRVGAVKVSIAGAEIDAIVDRPENHGPSEVCRAGGGIPAGDVGPVLDQSIEEARFEAMKPAANLLPANMTAGADDVVAADGIERGGFYRDRRASIPIPRSILLGSITACLFCGLRKCKTL